MGIPTNKRRIIFFHKRRNIGKKNRIDIPIIMCTGFSEKISEEHSESIGVNGFLKKPVVVRELAGKIREVLDQSV